MPLVATLCGLAWVSVALTVPKWPVTMYGMATDPLGLRIRRARERRRWTQKQLAEAMPASPQGRRPGVRSIGRWERGEAVPRNAIGALEVTLGISLSESGNGELWYNPEDPIERGIAEDPLLPQADKRAFIAQLRARREQYAPQAQEPPA